MVQGRKVVTRLELGRRDEWGALIAAIETLVVKLQALARVGRDSDCARHKGVEVMQSSENARMKPSQYLQVVFERSVIGGGAQVAVLSCASPC